jgi:xylan 1,4-beta-xylosidase
VFTRSAFLASCWLALVAATPLAAAEPDQVMIDFAATNGLIRPLHGINKGPLTGGGIIDLTARHRELVPPFNRLHDCHWPVPDVVDVHVVFPNFHADAANPASYDFAITDEYIAAVRATGAEVIYRLGESIEHTTVKRFVHPPRDPEQWAKICVGIVRHYNEGWARGTNANIRYWEIWNEPENRPVMWTGTDEQFLTLYAAVSRALKQHDAKLKVGGPAFGYTGEFVGGEFRASTFVSNFLARCRSESLPLDFFSWHCYTADPEELVRRAHAVRSLLDSFGFKKTESHLNEWNYLPNSTWTPLSRKAAPEVRQRAYDEIGSAAGAAFVAAALIGLQDAPVDVCNFYHADVGAFGLFSEQGVPNKTFYAMRAFRELLHTPRRVRADGAKKLSVLAGTSDETVQVLVVNSSAETCQQRFALKNRPWGKAEAVVRIVNSEHSFEPVSTNAVSDTLVLNLPGTSVALVTITARSKP